MEERYNKQEPDLEMLIDRLNIYSLIDYGSEKFNVSRAEAAALVARLKQLQKACPETSQIGE